jgi:hypothetical protein
MSVISNVQRKCLYSYSHRKQEKRTLWRGEAVFLVDIASKSGYCLALVYWADL